MRNLVNKNIGAGGIKIKLQRILIRHLISFEVIPLSEATLIIQRRFH